MNKKTRFSDKIKAKLDLIGDPKSLIDKNVYDYLAKVAPIDLINILERLIAIKMDIYEGDIINHKGDLWMFNHKYKPISIPWELYPTREKREYARAMGLFRFKEDLMIAGSILQPIKRELGWYDK